MTLDAGSPTFLKVVPDAFDPIIQRFSVIYDSSQAEETDIKVHVINYTIVSL